MLDEIENAIVETIKTELTYLHTVDSYAGQFDEVGLAEVIRSYPAVWVSFAGSGKPQKTGANTWKVPATFAVFCAARNVRNEKSARLGSATEVGAYQILKDVSILLLNQDLNMAIERFMPGATKVLFNTKINRDALAVYSQEWTTHYVMHAASEEEVNLLKIGVNYFLKPGDDVADATELLNITQ